MLLRRVLLRDFGVYRGEQCFDLAPRDAGNGRRPVVLIGGMNGVGKTTLLEAIRLCFYGRQSRGLIPRSKDYEQYLLQRIHRPRVEVWSPTGASVLVDFDYISRGQRHTFTVERAWEKTLDKPGIARESMNILKDGQPLTDVQAEFGSEFIQNLLPPALADLFFFDAERIRRLAEDDTDAETLSEAVKSLLGLDLVERLQSDLALYSAREAKRIVGKDLTIEIDRAQSDLHSSEAKLRSYREKRAEKQSELDFNTAQVEKAERSLAQQGYGLAQQREELLARRAVLDADVSRLEQEIRLLTDSSLPFALCPGLVSDLRTQLERERSGRQIAFLRNDLERLARSVRKGIKASSTLANGGFSSSMIEVVADEAVNVLRSQITSRTSTLEPPLHDFADLDEQRVLAWIEAANTQMSAQLHAAARSLERAIREQHHVATQVNQAPADDTLRESIEQLTKLSAHRGQVSSQLQRLDSELGQVEREVDQARRRIAKLTETAAQLGTGQNRLALASKLQSAAANYAIQLSDAKLAQLERYLLTSFNNLCRKRESLSEIKIDRQTFKVTLRDRHGRVLAKQELSEGEKQIYAIAVLDALAKSTQRHVPVIIDTPLGRLDSEHRDLLVNHYFPRASHQVILLSTDTEVDSQYFTELEPFLSHSLQVVYQSELGHSEIVPGYFWSQEGPDARSSRQTASL